MQPKGRYLRSLGRQNPLLVRHNVNFARPGANRRRALEESRRGLELIARTQSHPNPSLRLRRIIANAANAYTE